MANIVGIKGVTTEMIDFKDFNTDFPPGVLVFSAKEAEYKNLVKRRDWMQLYPALAETTDPDGFRNWNKHIFMPLMVEDPTTIDLVYPKTMDEMKAEQENLQLVDEEMPEVLPTDNHVTHIFTHNMIPPGKRTLAMWFHIASHEKAYAEQKAQEMAAAQMEMMGGPSGGQNGSKPNKINVGAERSSPSGATAPIKAETKPSNNLTQNNAK